MATTGLRRTGGTGPSQRSSRHSRGFSKYQDSEIRRMVPVTSRGAKDQSTRASGVATRTPNVRAGPWRWSTPKCPAVHGLVASSSLDRPPRSGHSSTKVLADRVSQVRTWRWTVPTCVFGVQIHRRRQPPESPPPAAPIASSWYFRGNGAASRRRQHKRITALRRTRGKWTPSVRSPPGSTRSVPSVSG